MLCYSNNWVLLDIFSHTFCPIFRVWHHRTMTRESVFNYHYHIPFFPACCSPTPFQLKILHVYQSLILVKNVYNLNMQGQCSCHFIQFNCTQVLQKGMDCSSMGIYVTISACSLQWTHVYKKYHGSPSFCLKPQRCRGWLSTQ